MASLNRGNWMKSSPTDENTPADRTSEPPVAPVTSVRDVVEAALFVGQEALEAESFCRAIPEVSPAEFEAAVEELRHRYRQENRPYHVRRTRGGYLLELKDPYRAELVGRWIGQRQIKLSRSAIDVLSVVTYRQPITKAGVDGLVGFDSAPALRQLVRRGLLMTGPSAEDEATPAYSTAPRFLEIFGLESMDDVPSSDQLDRPIG
ncbi:SMC-Scp complex subunit ScpB [bacterium]|nr:SMC-Scp complex subunit ScpB [bacterium]